VLFVFDANALISAILKPDSIPARALETAHSKGQHIFSRDTKSELLELVVRPKLEKYLSVGKRIEMAEKILGGLHPFRGIPVLAPREFLELFKK
jgi:predicted nucleic acid-binding protein